MADVQVNRSHHKASAGPKFEKKKKKREQKHAEAVGDTNKDDKKKKAPQNFKAFGVAHVNRKRLDSQRNRDIQHRKEVAPAEKKITDFAETGTPPTIVVVQGPPGSGKTTLIKSLVKRWTRHSLPSDFSGPVTVIASKKKRITFIECSCDLNTMTDLGKVADLCLLTINATKGFEMETFEFVNILQVHGMPKVMGVLTHLDQLKDNKALRKTKKRIKERFWKEIFNGAKMFFPSALKFNKYPKTEITIMGRHISQTKFRPLVWRSVHPYVLVDRLEKQEKPDDESHDGEEGSGGVTLTVFGYVRGARLRSGARAHLLGVGDFTLEEVTPMRDPCPLPDRNLRRTLNERETLLYAPMSNVGNLIFDGDAAYVNLNAARRRKVNDSEGAKLVAALKDAGEAKEDFKQSKALQLFKGGAELEDSDGEEEEDIENEEMLEEDDENEDTASEWSEEEEEVERRGWKSNLTERALKAHSDRVGRHPDLAKLVYEEDGMDDASEDEDDDDDEDDDAFFRPVSAKLDRRRKKLLEIPDSTKAALLNGDDDVDDNEDDDSDSGVQIDSSLFLKGAAASKFLPAKEETTGDDENDDNVYGDFEDLETGEKFGNGVDDDEEEDEEDENENGEEEEDEQALSGMDDEENDGLDVDESMQDFEDSIAKERAERAKRKAEAKSKQATVEQDDEVPEQAPEEIKGLSADDAFGNLSMEKRAELEGLRAGHYCRIVLHNVPEEFLDRFNPSYPFILGGLQPQEAQMTFMRARVKRHRWFPKILKTNDPLVFSIGWRRFQSHPLYSMEDQMSKERQRAIKYTPEHMHCMATFWAPAVAPNTGILAYQDMREGQARFRVSLTGTAVNVDKGTEIVKKLKLVGTPYKIFQRTAFVKDMFNSELEVARYEGAAVRTVSGVRGMIKKALKGESGRCRCTFEDKILMSDIVFLRAWVPVLPKQFYNPVCSLLEEWDGGMRTVAALRRDNNLPIPSSGDSVYRPIVREERRFNPLHIPESLQAKLPYASKPKALKPQTKKKMSEPKRLAVIHSTPEERKVYTLVQQLNTLRKEKEKVRKDLKRSKNEQRLKVKEREAKKLQQMSKESRKRAFREQGLKKQGAERKRARREADD